MNLNTKLLLIVIALLVSGGAYMYVDNSNHETVVVTPKPVEKEKPADKPKTVVPMVETGKVGKYSGQNQPAENTTIQPTEKGKVGLF